MRPIRSNADALQDANLSGTNESSSAVRSNLSPLINGYHPSQRPYSDRLENLEREMASLKGQVTQAFVSSTQETDLNRSYPTKKQASSPPSSARLPTNTGPMRKLSTDETPMSTTNDGPFSLPLPQVPVNRSRSFQNGFSPTPLASPPDEMTLVRSYKTHLEQVLRKDNPSAYSDFKVPNYSSIDDVMKHNEQLVLENDRLRSELNRLKTESILLLRSMRTTAGIEPNLGNERIMAERERQELATELTRQVEENRRLRKSLLIQSEKFVKLRQSTNPNDNSLPIATDHRSTPVSVPQALLNPTKNGNTAMKSTRFLLGNLGLPRPRTFNHGSHDPF